MFTGGTGFDFMATSLRGAFCGPAELREARASARL